MKKRQKPLTSTLERMLIGMTFGLACSLCALEFGKPLVASNNFLGSVYVAEDEWELPPIVVFEKPKPKPAILPKIEKRPPSTEFVVVENEQPVPEETDSVVINLDPDEPVITMEARAEVVKQPDIFRRIEQMPEFPGGDKGLSRFLSKNLKYPAREKREGIQGLVRIQFVVTEDGTVDPDNITVIRSVHPALDAEAIRVIQSMPPWKPGRQRGVPVSAFYIQAFNFQLR